MSLGTNYSLYCLECCQNISESGLQAKDKEDCLMCCPIQRSHQKRLNTSSSYRRVTRRQVMRHFTSNNTDQCQNGSSNNLLTPYREQPRPTRIVAPYPRPAFSVTERSNHAPTIFDQHAQVSQGHTSCRNKEN